MELRSYGFRNFRAGPVDCGHQSELYVAAACPSTSAHYDHWPGLLNDTSRPIINTCVSPSNRYGEELAHMLRRFLDPDPATRLGTDIDEVQAHSAWTRVTEELGGPPAAATESPWEVHGIP